jgi:signal transduction histidine kinase/DNA-binding response OmpR family regulator
MTHASTEAPLDPPAVAMGSMSGSFLADDSDPVASILAVDDNVANLVALEAILEPLGQPIVRARSGTEALAQLAQREFAAVLMDVEMPAMDGFEAAARIRSASSDRPVPILFFTAHAPDTLHTIRSRGFALGAFDVLTKPFDPEMLRAKVSVFVQLYMARERLRLRTSREQFARAAVEAQTRRARQAALAADVGLALTHAGNTREVLQRCTQAIVTHLDAAFARIWTVDATGKVLELKASAGLYTHIDGGHACVPVGALKIGRIAESRKPHLTNDVLHDPNVGDPAWAAREGLVAFAGYPLRVEDRLVGVAALFARQPLPDDTLESLASIADTIALGIDRKRAEEALRASEQTERFLAEASALLSSSLDYETTLTHVTRLAVPRFGDWCGVDLLQSDGTLRALAVAHVDPAKVELARALRQKFPENPDAPIGSYAVLRSGKSELIESVSDDLLAAATQDEEQLRVVRELGLRSWMIVPLVAHGRAVGTLSLVRAESGRPYTREDLHLAEELGRRAAIAVENARLFEEVKQLNATLEHRVNERTAALTEANRELEAFTYTVSHDLRAPVRHMSGFVDLLERHARDRLDERGIRYVRTIGDSAKQMGRLIDALLAFSRIGRVDIGHVRVDLGALVREVRQSFEPDLASRRVHWSIATLPEVIGDATLLRIVLANLVSNALKYTASRQEAHIEIGTTHDADGWPAVFVRDNGVGFNPAYTNKLFGVFQRLHNDPQFEGTGIGLATVRRIVQRHGGRVWAEGRPDAGATFFFSLPPSKEISR